MFFYLKYHINKIYILIFLILLGCQLQEPVKNHGILFLENRSNKLVLLETNKNDTLKIFGQPHTKSMNDEDQWIYIERTLSKGKFHKLGQNVLKTNNVLILTFVKIPVLVTPVLDAVKLTLSPFEKVALAWIASDDCTMLL